MDDGGNFVWAGGGEGRGGMGRSRTLYLHKDFNFYKILSFLLV